MRLQVAVGILVATFGIPVEAARERLRDAAVRAGVDDSAMAKIVIEQALQGGDDAPEDDQWTQD